ncbi:MAG: carboxypeptidase-like regulatory domain-containing protein, partial [Myxococcaceae bacterium]
MAYRVEEPDLPPQDLAPPTVLLEGLTLGQHLRVTVRALDAAGNASAPLYAEVAPAPKDAVPDGDVSADFCAANQFLVKGQAIPCALFSVVTGRVLSSEGAGIPSLRVSVLGHEEFGAAFTRADGVFALAVPAGAWTLDIRAAAFMPAQRWVTAQPGDYSPLENDIAVLRRDEAMTKVSVAAGGFHRATARKDKDGERQVALFIPPGNAAALHFADGGTVATDTVSLRVTEATVGELGPEAMPASLPAATAYTFAADFSADEAVAAGADGVRFTRPVAFYVDNFLEFPIGTPVPQGTYDSRAGKWEAQAASVVVKVLAGGQLDSDGDGAADTAAALLPGEAEVLAREFSPGTVLWRGTTTHFSAVDCNGNWVCVGTCGGGGGG